MALKPVCEEVDDPNLYSEGIDGESALIIDAMAMLQTITVLRSTFGELAKVVLLRFVNFLLIDSHNLGAVTK